MPPGLTIEGALTGQAVDVGQRLLLELGALLHGRPAEELLRVVDVFAPLVPQLPVCGVLEPVQQDQGGVWRQQRVSLTIVTVAAGGARSTSPPRQYKLGCGCLTSQQVMQTVLVAGVRISNSVQEPLELWDVTEQSHLQLHHGELDIWLITAEE
jgi:hypothetical protein